MNTQYLFSTLFKCWLFHEFIITQSAGIAEVKFDIRSSNENGAHAKRFQPKERSYLYLNYKEAYGLRFDPKKIQRKPFLDVSSNVESSWNDAQTDEVTITTINFDDDVQMISISPENISNETTTISSPSSDDASITTQTTIIDNKVLLTESTRPIRQPVLAFSTLLNRVNALKQQNTTKITPLHQTPSVLRDTLQLIRKRIKQWMSFGINKQAPLINGQRFLNVFNVIKFDNSPCTPTQEGLNDMSGICYHDYQCAQMGGSSIDECADGLGVCCVCKEVLF